MAVQMTKSQLIEKIAVETSISKKEVKGVLETLASVGDPAGAAATWAWARTGSRARDDRIAKRMVCLLMVRGDQHQNSTQTIRLSNLISIKINSPRKSMTSSATRLTFQGLFQMDQGKPTLPNHLPLTTKANHFPPLPTCSCATSVRGTARLRGGGM